MSRTERWLTRSVRPEPLRKSASQQADGRRGRALLAHPAHRASAPERTCDVLRNPDIFTCSRQPWASLGQTCPFRPLNVIEFSLANTFGVLGFRKDFISSRLLQRFPLKLHRILRLRSSWRIRWV